MDSTNDLIKEYGYLNFKCVTENWSEYLIEDGTLLRIKTVPLKFLQEDEKNIGMNATNVLATFSPKEMRGEPSSKPITNSDIQSSIDKQDVEFDPKNEPWNEYEGDNGFKVFLKTVVTLVSSTKLKDNYGEPVYVVQHQTLIKKYPV